MKFDLYKYRFGVNYTPSRNWWYCWNDFHPESIARDLDSIAAVGADHIRIMVIWPYFQPNPGTVSEVHLERLKTMMTLAGERDLDVCVSMLVGWLSGFRFNPFFLKEESIYSSERLWAAQELYFRRVAEAMRGHDNFIGFDLGNEIGCCWKTLDTDVGDKWHNRMMSLVHELFPKHVHSNGIDHQPWFERNTFSPRIIATNQPAAILHSYVYFTGALKRAGGDPFARPCTHLIPAMSALARSYAGDASKPVWVQEYGMSEDWMDKAGIPRFLEETTIRSIEGGATWFTWWASHDIDRKFTFAPLEYCLGLISVDQKIKPQGEAFRRLAEA